MSSFNLEAWNKTNNTSEQNKQHYKQRKQARKENRTTMTNVAASPTFRLHDDDITVAMVTVDDEEVEVKGHTAAGCKADGRCSVSKQHHLA